MLEQFRTMTQIEMEEVRAEIVARCTLLGDCWAYETTDTSGYGTKYIAGKMRSTSRFMLCYSTREPLDIKADACHNVTCPYRACCNPKHLAWGTHLQNIQQRDAKRKEYKDYRWESNRSNPPALGYETHEEHAVWLAGLRTSDPERWTRIQELGTVDRERWERISSKLFPEQKQGGVDTSPYELLEGLGSRGARQGSQYHANTHV